jgi:hypothetical protein
MQKRGASKGKTTKKGKPKATKKAVTQKSKLKSTQAKKSPPKKTLKKSKNTNKKSLTGNKKTNKSSQEIKGLQGLIASVSEQFADTVNARKAISMPSGLSQLENIEELNLADSNINPQNEEEKVPLEEQEEDDDSISNPELLNGLGEPKENLEENVDNGPMNKVHPMQPIEKAMTPNTDVVGKDDRGEKSEPVAANVGNVPSLGKQGNLFSTVETIKEKKNVDKDTDNSEMHKLVGYHNEDGPFGSPILNKILTVGEKMNNLAHQKDKDMGRDEVKGVIDLDGRFKMWWDFLNLIVIVSLMLVMNLALFLCYASAETEFLRNKRSLVGLFG